MPDERLSQQDREARAQNVATIKARRKGVVARMRSESVTDHERALLDEELQSIDANLQTLGELDQIGASGVASFTGDNPQTGRFVDQ